MKILKNHLVMGTLILTLTGFITRIIGFFYRIFISHTFGEEGMGIYQLIGPVMAFSFSLCCAGIQTAISKYVAEAGSHKAHRLSFRILFISVLLSVSLSVLLLPIVSEAEGNGNLHKIALAIRKSITWCAILGCLCSAFFFCFGKIMGMLLFHSAMAEQFIRGLSFICPFLYITATLGSILHGLGKTFSTFLINILALSIRIFSIFYLVPRIGISGYLAGLLLGQLFAALACIFCLKEYRLY